MQKTTSQDYTYKNMNHEARFRLQNCLRDEFQALVGESVDWGPTAPTEMFDTPIFKKIVAIATRFNTCFSIAARNTGAAVVDQYMPDPGRDEVEIIVRPYAPTKRDISGTIDSIRIILGDDSQATFASIDKEN